MAHSYIIGQSGTGKSTLLKTQILDRIAAGDGVFFLDPHGYDIDELLQYIPKRRRKDVVLFDPSQFTIPWNPLNTEHRDAFVAGSLAEAIKDAWGYAGASTPRMDLCIYNSVAALVEAEQPFLGFYLLLTSTNYRHLITEKLEDRAVRDYWLRLDRLSERDRNEQIDSTLNKVAYLFADPLLRSTFSNQRSKLDLADILAGKILLARLPQSVLGIQKVATLGSLLISQLHHAALSRDPSAPFHVYIDEFHHFAKGAMKEMYSGSRKFGLCLTVAHQYIDQVPQDLWSAVLGNARTRYVFRVSREDARRIDVKRALYELDELPNYRARMAIGAETIDHHVAPLPGRPSTAAQDAVFSNMRRNFHTPSAEKAVDRFLEDF